MQASCGDVMVLQENLKMFKQTINNCAWVVPTTLKHDDDRDRQITKKNIYGILKEDIYPGYDYDKKEISLNLARVLFVMAFEKYFQSLSLISTDTARPTLNPWSYFDTLDKRYCLTMVVYFEKWFETAGLEQPFNKELMQFIEVKQADVTKSELADNWFMRQMQKKKDRTENIRRNVKSKDKSQLPKTLLRLTKVAEYVPIIKNMLTSAFQLLVKVKVDPITEAETMLFKVPHFAIDTMRADHEYAADGIRALLKYNKTRTHLKELSAADFSWAFCEQNNVRELAAQRYAYEHEIQELTLRLSQATAELDLGIEGAIARDAAAEELRRLAQQQRNTEIVEELNV